MGVRKILAMRFILALAVLLSLTIVKAAECPTNPHPKDCDDSINICRISCDAAQCKKEGDACATIKPDSEVDLTFDSLTASECERLCIRSRNNTEVAETAGYCRFWREEGESLKKHCSFMNGEQCVKYEWCNHNSEHCQGGDVGCRGDDGKPQPPDDKQTCASGIEFHPDDDADPKGLYIHWACESEDSPYNDTPMPAKTHCFTIQTCSNWEIEATVPPDQLTLQVRCDGTKGKWTTDSIDMVAVYQGVLGPEGENRGSLPLNELKCVGTSEKQSLVVTKEAMGAGSQLSCTDPPTIDDAKGEYTITAPNLCILLCDFHLGMTIEGRLKEETGDWGFFIVETDTEITDPNMVRCWPEL